MKRLACFARFAPAWLILGATWHCGWIVGAADYTVGGGEPDATVGDATPVSGGDAQDSTTENQGGDALATALLDADAEPSVDAGVGILEDAGANLADAAEASAVTCGQGLPAGQPSFEGIVRTCVLASSCGPFSFEANIGSCITFNLLHARQTYACLTTIRDCNGYFQCTGFRNSTPADCPPTAPAARCDTANNTVIDCNRGVVTSCDRSGGTCATYTNDAGTDHASCVVVPSCTETDGVARCSGSKVYTCLGGIGVGADCVLQNETCNAPEGGADCYFDGPPCPTPNATCAGGAATVCYVLLNRQFRYDCTGAGLSCTLGDAGLPVCLAPGCTSFATCPPVETCGADGKTLTVCVGGAPFTIDCTKLGAGFTSCTTRTARSTGLVYGVCQ